MSKHSRRQIGEWLLLGLASMPLLVAGKARGQESSAELLKVLSTTRQLVQGSYASIRSSIPITEEDARRISEESYHYRAIVAGLLQVNYLATNGSVDADVYYSGFLDPNTAYLAKYMYEAGVPLVPDPLEIQQDPFAKPAPTSSEWLLVIKESKWGVVLDISLDAFGLLDIKELVLEVLVQVYGYTEQKASLEKALEKRDPEQIRDALFSFIEWLILKAGIEALLKGLIERRVAAVALRSLSLRCVPFLGWGYLLLAFGLSINRHWDRLVE